MITNIQMPLDEAIRKSSESLVLFGHTFFGRSFRQTSPMFHYEMSDLLLTPGNRLVGFKVYRGGAKTSIARVHAAFKPAYGLGQTGMIISHDAAHAYRTARWVMKQVEFNALYSKTFGLRKGSKWTPEWFEIVNTKLDMVYSYVAMGITGSVRGVNLDDFRADYILCDDILDPENVATPEQRKKVEDTVFGGLLFSLAPATESPLAQMVLLQTPLDKNDIINKAEEDTRFKVLSYSCFDNAGQSSWPQRWATDTLLADKAAFIKKKQLYLWMREMECKIIEAEQVSFDSSWFLDFDVTPDEIENVVTVDPAPVEIDAIKKDKDRDFNVVSAMGFTDKDAWVHAQHGAQNEAPDETIHWIFEYCREYNTRTVIIETIAYQKVLAWMLQEEMKKRRIWLTIVQFPDERTKKFFKLKKSDRIIQAVVAIAPFGHLHIRSTCTALLTQLGSYGVGYTGKDDHMDGMTIGLCWKQWPVSQSDAAIEGEYKRLRDEDDAHFGREEEEVGVRFQGCP